jgi:hypothetical protein
MQIFSSPLTVDVLNHVVRKCQVILPTVCVTTKADIGKIAVEITLTDKGRRETASEPPRSPRFENL